MTRIYYIDPSGHKTYARPRILAVGGHNYFNHTDDQLTANGWQIVTEEIPEYQPTYEERVVALIRERYDLDSELAILRQRDTKPTEYAEYFEYCEECKQRAKNE